MVAEKKGETVVESAVVGALVMVKRWLEEVRWWLRKGVAESAAAGAPMMVRRWLKGVRWWLKDKGEREVAVEMAVRGIYLKGVRWLLMEKGEREATAVMDVSVLGFIYD